MYTYVCPVHSSKNNHKYNACLDSIENSGRSKLMKRQWNAPIILEHFG